MRNELLSDNEWVSLKETIGVYRQRLYDISWTDKPFNRTSLSNDG
jgi:hypothetical protein